MPAHHGGGRPKSYMHPEHGRVPSVTTVLDRFRDAGGLIAWAIREGWQAETLRDEASYVGSAVHAVAAELVIDRGYDWMADLEADESMSPTMFDEAVTAARTFLRWLDGPGSEWSFQWVELPLISSKRRVGGTPDFYGIRWDGVRATFDLKTGKRLSVENKLQGAAYVELCRENGWPCDEHRVIHCPRDGGRGSEVTVAGKDLDLAAKTFAKLRWCYDAVAMSEKFHATLLARG